MPCQFTAQLDKLVLTHQDIAPHITALSHQTFTGQIQGYSAEGRSIHTLQLGNGDIRILAWSQMHGDESTATAALIDLAYHLAETQPAWLQKISLTILPMLNPDGAQRQSRYNAHGIDINRDALALQSPEGRILQKLVREFAPHWAFNLHDQDRWYRAGPDGLPATLSFLATAADEARTLTPARRKAMGLMGQWLSQKRPPKTSRFPYQDIGVGRYNDTYNALCFGDAIASQDIPVVLVESGYKADDPTRQTARACNSAFLLFAFKLIAQNRVSDDINAYQAIPMNQENGCADLVITQLQLAPETRVDLVIRGDKVDPKRASGTIADIGDYRHLYAYQHLDAAGKSVISGKSYVVTDPITLDKASYRQLLQQGYLTFFGDPNNVHNTSGWPIHWLTNKPIQANTGSLTLPQRGDIATLAIGENNRIETAIICGVVIALDQAV